MGNEIKPGVETSEHAAMKSSGFWGVVLAVLGVVVTVGSQVLASMSPEQQASKTGVIVGAVVSIAGIILKLTTSTAYIQGRSNVKQAAEESKGGQ